MTIIEAALEPEQDSNTWRTQHIADEITSLRATLSKANYLLVQAYLACIKPEWEKGKTIDEVTDMICAFLWNQGLQPKLAEHEESVRQLVSAHERTVSD